MQDARCNCAFCVLHLAHSYRNASTGLRFDTRQAGYNPPTAPSATIIATPTAMPEMVKNIRVLRLSKFLK